ncbi:MAG: super-infection exclusion protein B [candidate division WOR-3 bacterium]|nr:super-infection exclusion protein B [candidate division WOR-3 bacterium]
MKPRILFWLWLAFIALALLPGLSPSVAPLGILHSLRGWFWLAALLVFALWLVQLVVPPASDALRRVTAKRAVKSLLSALSDGERLILCLCLTDSRQSVPFGLTDPDTVSLVQKGLLERAEGLVDIRVCPHAVPDFVWKHMKSDEDSVWGHWDRNSPEVRLALAALRDRISRNVQEVRHHNVEMGDY